VADPNAFIAFLKDFQNPYINIGSKKKTNNKTRKPIRGKDQEKQNDCS
jgi:hypothetical protein